MFASLYERAIVWARHRHAVRYLAGLSFVEAFIFPIMPEVMLAPMMLAEPRKAFRYANWSLLFSLAGSLVGYML
ncbi:membrane protein, partial [Xanthomonas hyacinthi DSM 19077]